LAIATSLEILSGWHAEPIGMPPSPRAVSEMTINLWGGKYLFGADKVSGIDFGYITGRKSIFVS